MLWIVPVAAKFRASPEIHITFKQENNPELNVSIECDRHHRLRAK
jgi:hypothetical protein